MPKIKKKRRVRYHSLYLNSSQIALKERLHEELRVSLEFPESTDSGISKFFMPSNLCFLLAAFLH